MAYIHLDNDPSHRHELTQPVTTVGRAETNDIVLDGDMRVSRQHARLNLQEGQWVLTDSNSANGTLVNGERVTSHSLRHGDRSGLAMRRSSSCPSRTPWPQSPKSRKKNPSVPALQASRSGSGSF